MRRTKRAMRPKRTKHDQWWSRPTNIHPQRRMTLAEGVADQIRRAILLGDVKHGTRLEPCRVMAREASVGVGVVREALAQLRGEGLIQVRHGVGVFVTARRRKARMLRAAQRTATRREVLAMRAALEPVAAAAAARRPTSGQLMELRLRLEERDLERRAGDSESFAAADVEFHRAVVRMSGNRLAAAGAELAGPVLAGQLTANARHLAQDYHLQLLHERLVDAIELGRQSRARRAAQAIAAREGEPVSRPP